MMSQREARILKHVEAMKVGIEALRKRVEESTEQMLDTLDDADRRLTLLERSAPNG